MLGSHQTQEQHWGFRELARLLLQVQGFGPIKKTERKWGQYKKGLEVPVGWKSRGREELWPGSGMGQLRFQGWGRPLWVWVPAQCAGVRS